MPNATSAAAAKAAAKALRLARNEDVSKYFAVGICGIILLFTLLHWTGLLYEKFNLKVGALGMLVSLTRLIRKLLIWKVPGLVSIGHLLVVLCFAAVVLGVTLGIDWDRSQLQFFGHRLGWLTAADLVLVVFLSLKNTPLAILTAHSYEKLNLLHQVAGYSLITFTLSHTVVMCVAWGRKHNLSEFLLTKNVVGMIAGCAMLVILASATLLRRFQYETFHIVHITMAALIIITTGTWMYLGSLIGFQLSSSLFILGFLQCLLVAVHQPNYPIIGKIAIIAASIWIADRLLRMAKLLLYSFGNTATITPLPCGGTRIVLRKTPVLAHPGTHCFLWIPGVRATECHPFTIMSTKPFEMVVAAYDGFTRDLHQQAVKNPGQVLRAPVDGPYGQVPNFKSYDKLLFITGGSGASFTCGVAVDVLRKLSDSSTTTMEFVWVMKEEERVEWFVKELEELVSSPRVNIHIHSTHPTSSLPTKVSNSTTSIQEKKQTAYEINSATVSDSDVEKQPARSTSILISSLGIKQGRPHIAALVANMVAGAEKNDRVVVAVCGPESMMQDARKSVAENITAAGPSLELHSEHFGW